MRYYRIEITDKDGNYIKDVRGQNIGPFESSTSPLSYTSPTPTKQPKSNGGALHISFDFPVIACDLNVTGGALTLYGLPATMLNQSVNLYLANIRVFAGFQNGLPLATSQAQRIPPRMIVSGQIWNAYGNWQGVEQTLNLVVNASEQYDDDGNPLELTYKGTKGEKLSDVIVRMMKGKFKKKAIRVDINPDIVLSESETGITYSSISDFAFALKENSKSQDVDIAVTPDTIVVYDRQAHGNSVTIAGWDLIGQPTWIDFNTVSFKIPMRGDISIADRVTLPRSLTSGPAGVLALSNNSRNKAFMNNSFFTGDFQVKSVRHVGDFRNPSGDAWVTIVEAIGIYR